MSFIRQQSVTYKLDQIIFELQERHDFTWLQSLGTVFAVFAQQDSGNISFGVEMNGIKRFVKYAGCRTMEYSGDPKEAVSRLLAAIPLYTNLKHPYLIRMVDHFETTEGYAAVFEWFNGECLHSHWLYAGEAKHHHPESPFYKFKQLSVNKRLQSFDAILVFHQYVELKGYVAVDFYDGSILYDFSKDKTIICDIDFYRVSPSVNEIGENFWGASRSKAPEEFILGSPLDAITNVYTLGAVAFGLLGGETDHSYTKWDAGRLLYEVALKAVSKERDGRYNSVVALKAAWDLAKKQNEDKGEFLD